MVAGRAAVTTCTSFKFYFQDNTDAVLAFFASASIHCWAVFVREGYLINEKSIEDPDRLLDDEFTFTYFMDSRAT